MFVLNTQNQLTVVANCRLSQNVEAAQARLSSMRVDLLAAQEVELITRLVLDIDTTTPKISQKQEPDPKIGVVFDRRAISVDS